MDIHKILAANMRRLRREQRLTQDNLAKKCGLHRTYIGGIEQARVNVSLTNIGKIADALGVNPALLFAGPAADAANKDEEQAADLAAEGESSATEESVSYYYLGMQEGNGFTLDPIDVDDPDLTVQILVGLIQDGYAGEELAKRYADTKQKLLDFFHEEHRNKRVQAGRAVEDEVEDDR